MKPNRFQDFLKSFYNKFEEGMSARKLTAFTLMACIVYGHLRFVDVTVIVEVLIIDLSAVALLLGIVTVQNLIEFKTGIKDKGNEQK